jgi:hypothetical protein
MAGTHDFSVDESLNHDAQIFRGEWDEEGVFVYQAFNESIAAWAVEHQRFGGPLFKAKRMTWIKPSFSWILYRSGYAQKHNQERILKIKLSHATLAQILSQCQCKHGGGGSIGRVQWDPARDLMTPEGKGKRVLPRKMLRERAIQIGMKDSLSEYYVGNTLSIEDVTGLALKVYEAHQAPHSGLAMEALERLLPRERGYLPACPVEVLCRLALLPGEAAEEVEKLGRGKTSHSK